MLPQKLKVRLKVLGWYQIIGSTAGLLVTIWLFAHIDHITGLLLLLYLTGFVLNGFSLYCGRLLLSDKYILGLRLTLINQILQIFSFIVLGWGFMYFSGIALWGSIKYDDGIKIGLDLKILSNWFIYVNSDDTSFYLSVNFFSIYLVYFVENLTTNIKAVLSAERYNKSTTEDIIVPY